MDTNVRAQLRFLRIAPRKVRLVAAAVRGLPVNLAEARLMLLPNRSAKPLLKLLRSAMANAKNIKKLDPLKMQIKSVSVDQAPLVGRKRYMPRARGAMSEIQKKMSHITIELAEMAEPKEAKFKIITVKKKKEVGDGKKTKRERSAKGGEVGSSVPAASKPGVLKRVFRRKVGSAD